MKLSVPDWFVSVALELEAFGTKKLKGSFLCSEPGRSRTQHEDMFHGTAVPSRLDPRDQTQVNRLCSKYLYPLSLFISPLT